MLLNKIYLRRAIKNKKIKQKLNQNKTNLKKKIKNNVIFNDTKKHYS